MGVSDLRCLPSLEEALRVLGVALEHCPRRPDLIQARSLLRGAIGRILLGPEGDPRPTLVHHVALALQGLCTIF